MLSTSFSIRAVRWGVCIVIVAAIIAGLYVSGSPATRRREALDQQRVNHLDQLTYAVDAFYQTRGTLPPTLADVVQQQPQIATSINDPATQASYEYWEVSSSTKLYQLCANFDLATSPEERSVPVTPMAVGQALVDLPSWYHTAGRNCFSLRVRPSPEVPAVIPKPLPKQ